MFKIGQMVWAVALGCVHWGKIVKIYPGGPTATTTVDLDSGWHFPENALFDHEPHPVRVHDDMGTYTKWI